MYRPADPDSMFSMSTSAPRAGDFIDAALRATENARHALSRGDAAAKAANLADLIRIVDEGFGDGETSAIGLSGPAAMREHIVSRVFIASLHDSDVPLAEIGRLLTSMRASPLAGAGDARRQPARPH